MNIPKYLKLVCDDERKKCEEGCGGRVTNFHCEYHNGNAKSHCECSSSGGGSSGNGGYEVSAGTMLYMKWQWGLAVACGMFIANLR